MLQKDGKFAATWRDRVLRKTERRGFTRHYPQQDETKNQPIDGVRDTAMQHRGLCCPATLSEVLPKSLPKRSPELRNVHILWNIAKLMRFEYMRLSSGPLFGRG
jgi:hypothetical protein